MRASLTMQPSVPYPNLQADYVSKCVFWDFALNGNCFKVELNMQNTQAGFISVLLLQMDLEDGTRVAVMSETAQTTRLFAAATI